MYQEVYSGYYLWPFCSAKKLHSLSRLSHEIKVVYKQLILNVFLWLFDSMDANVFGDNEAQKN